MKKLKLLFAAAAAMVGLSANAQLTDGTVYWIQDAATGQFISQGANWGTQATVQEVGGLGVQAVYVSDGVYKLKNIMWNKVNSADLGLRTSDRFWDQSAGDVTLIASGDGYKINTTDGGYLCNNGDTNDDGVKRLGSTTDEAAATVWKFLTKSEYDAAIQAYKDGNAATYATNLGYTANTVAALEEILANDYMAKDYTSSITNPTLSSSWDGWIHAAASGSNRAEGAAVGNGCAEFWNGCGAATQTVSGLPNGLYKVEFVGTFRPKGSGNSEKLASGETSSPAFVYANDAKVEFLHWIDVPAKANGRSGITKANGYGQSFYTYVSDGTLKLGVVQGCWEYGEMWCPFGQFTLTYYSDQVEDADITTLVGTIPTEVPTAVANNLASLKSALESAKTIAAYNALDAAIKDAAPIVTEYARYKAVKAAVLAIKSDIDVSAADGLVEAATTTEGIDAAVATVRGALATYLAGANITNDKIDLTAALIDNASPGTAGNTNYWTNSSAPGLEYNLYEFYNVAGATSKQTIATQLPIGYYTLTVVGYTRDGYDGFINAGTNIQTLVGVASGTVNNRNQGNSWIEDGNGVNAMTFNLTEAKSNLEIGITAGQTGDRWTVWRSFKLEYLGTAPLAKFQQDLADAVDAANNHANNDLTGKIPTSALDAYTSAISTAAVKNSTTDECLQAIADIESATNIADALVLPYDAWLAMKAKADILVTVANDNSTANATLASAINTQEANAEAATTVADIESATSELKAAMTTYVFAANPVGDGAQFDCTFLMTNPDLTGLPIWNKCDGWTSEETDGNYQVMVNDSKTQGDKSYFYEYWSSPAKASGNFALYNAVTLPKGTFSMSCYAFAEDQYTNSTVDGVYFYANETQGSCVTATKLTEQNLTFVNNKEQEVKIGLKTVTGNTRNWMGIGYVELYKVPAKSYEIDETKAWDKNIAGAGDVTLKRTIKKGINTLVLPFSMTQAEVEENFGEGSKVYVAKAYNDATKNISFATNDGINANKPCLLEVPEAGNGEYSLKDRAIVAGEPVFNGTNVTTTGTYAESFTVPTTGYDYVISSGKIYNVDSEVTLKNTRAYITVAGGNAARTLTMSFDDETTGIATLKNGELKFEKGDIYDLSGRKVKNPTKGIYLMNGKKVIK